MVNRHGQRLHPLVALVRAVCYVIFPMGLLWVLVSGHNRSLQDLVVRTSVIYDWDVRPLPHLRSRPGPESACQIASANSVLPTGWVPVALTR